MSKTFVWIYKRSNILVKLTQDCLLMRANRKWLLLNYYWIHKEVCHPIQVFSATVERWKSKSWMRKFFPIILYIFFSGKNHVESLITVFYFNFERREGRKRKSIFYGWDWRLTHNYLPKTRSFHMRIPRRRARAPVQLQ